ncbi:hypothetical protein [Corallococcus sp. 4LFB]|uniref:hypothetical protein n=1 Tax=Corallococcus sp. 4LFB TaxID=3383249 RepID=UPI0039766F88
MTHDLRITGPDAEATGRAHYREFDPRYIFDRADPDDAVEQVERFARKEASMRAGNLSAYNVPARREGYPM